MQRREGWIEDKACSSLRPFFASSREAFFIRARTPRQFQSDRGCSRIAVASSATDFGSPPGLRDTSRSVRGSSRIVRGSSRIEFASSRIVRGSSRIEFASSRIVLGSSRISNATSRILPDILEWSHGVFREMQSVQFLITYRFATVQKRLGRWLLTFESRPEPFSTVQGLFGRMQTRFERSHGRFERSHERFGNVQRVFARIQESSGMFGECSRGSKIDSGVDVMEVNRGVDSMAWLAAGFRA
jgi:hypothetical protein